MYMRLFKNLTAKILKIIITWSEMGTEAAQAKDVYYLPWNKKADQKAKSSATSISSRIINGLF